MKWPKDKSGDHEVLQWSEFIWISAPPFDVRKRFALPSVGLERSGCAPNPNPGRSPQIKRPNFPEGLRPSAHQLAEPYRYLTLPGPHNAFPGFCPVCSPSFIT